MATRGCAGIRLKRGRYKAVAGEHYGERFRRLDLPPYCPYVGSSSEETTMTQPDKDASVLAHIERLVSEEHRLVERGELNPEETNRLSTVRTELDQCWDLLRQRRALREYGEDPSKAHAREADVVKKYVG
jgi:hypothetical protein